MRGSGSDPPGSDPDVVRALEDARRALYRPGRDTGDVAAYELLRSATPEPVESPAWRLLDDEHPAAVRRSRRGTALLLGGAVLVAAVAAAVLTAPPAVPRRLPSPALAGTTLVALDRPEDPTTHAGSVTYQPEGYTVFQPAGRVVAVALTCSGEGRVRISAGRAFDFRCGAERRTMRMKAVRGSATPFVVMGRTVGDVVWAARVVLLSADTSGAIPGFGDGCSSCTTASG